MAATARWTTDSVPAGERVHAYKQVIGNTFVPLAVGLPGCEQDEFRMNIRTTTVTDISISTIRGAPHEVRRTRRMVQSGAAPFFKLCRQVEGTAVLLQDGAALRLEPGEMVLYDTRRPYELIFEGPYVQQVVFIPGPRLRVQGGQVQSVMAQKHRADAGLEHLLTKLIHELDWHADELSEPQRYAASASVLTLLDSAVESWCDGRDDGFSRVLAFVDARLRDAGVGLAEIASAHHMSVRTLQAMFSRHSLTVSGYIRSRRLELSRQDLMSPLLRDKTVTEIAHGWGFSDSAHYSRLFKSAYGQSPSELRRLAVS